MRRLPRIVGHRGASYREPENTAAAFDAALEEGADGIELDLQLSRDGVVVVFHDATLARMGLRGRRVSDIDWSELQRLDVGRWFEGRASGHRMLRIEEVLERWGRRTCLYLEIKHAEGRRGRVRHRQLAEAVAGAIVRAGLTRRSSVLSFHDQAIETVAAMAPEIDCVRNLRWVPGLVGLRRVRNRVAGISVDIHRFGPGQARALADLKRPLYAYTCDSRAELRRALALRVDYVITNRPVRSRRRLEEIVAAD